MSHDVVYALLLSTAGKRTVTLADFNAKTRDSLKGDLD